MKIQVTSSHPLEPAVGPGNRSPSRGYRAGFIAAASALLVYFAATGSEILVIRSLQPSEIELTWISDGILAVAFGCAIFLWLHLKRTRLALSTLEREHIMLDTQLSIAASIQRSLLPAPPVPAEGARWAARLEQAGRIGGDMYDFVRGADGSWLVLVGDVSGKGIPAALVLSSIRTMFRMTIEQSSDPGELVARISQRLYADNGGTPYLTCVLARVDLETFELAYVNAGHPAGLVLNDSGGKRSRWLLESCGPPAGLFPDQRYQARTLQLTRGAAAILVTDGITEAFDELGLSATDPIASVVAALPQPLAPNAICDALMERTAPALAHHGTGWQDDRTVVSFVLDE